MAQPVPGSPADSNRTLCPPGPVTPDGSEKTCCDECLGIFHLFMLGINISDLIWFSKFLLYIIYVIKLRQTEAPSPTEPVGQLIADMGIDMEESFEMVAEEEPPKPSSSTGDPGDQDEWGAAWAKELETEMKKKDAAGWRLG